MNVFSRLARFSVLFLQLFHTLVQMMYGAWRITSLAKPIVSIFGGSRFVQDAPYAKKAHQLGRMFVSHGISVLTGAGPGIMEAASCGAFEKGPGGAKSIGIGVTSLGDNPNQCVNEYFELDYFFSRKWLLTHYSRGYVFFPGGFGTIDELGEVLTLMQTKQLSVVPIVLIGTEFWKDFVDWMYDELIAHDLIAKEHLTLFKVTDDLEEAFCWIIGKCDLV
jgi:uncharacterized protein (TIGR00730 family)